MILCTGHLGFIGKYLTRELTQYVGIDLKGGHNLLTCKLPENIDLIYHLAAQSDVAPSWDDPLHDLDNVRMTARLAHVYPETKIIYANSCASMDASTPYGFSKWASGEYLKRFHKNTVSCVFPNIYGKGSRSVVDIIKEHTTLTVYGDGQQTRDYVHVSDIVKGLIKAAHWTPGEYFMGSGKSYSVLDIAKGKKKMFAEARKEPKEVNVPNTTPNWKPTINVLDYV